MTFGISWKLTWSCPASSSVHQLARHPIWHVRHLVPGDLLEIRGSEMLRAAVPDRAVVELARLRFGRVDQIRDGGDRQRVVDDDDVGQRGDEGDRLEGRQRIVADLVEQGLVDGQRARGGDQDRVAVRLGAGHGRRPEIAARAGLVLDHEAVPEVIGHALQHDPADDIARAAARERHDDPDGPARVILCGQRQGSPGRRNSQTGADETARELTPP
jgi:hypothetical protein